ncbi:DUF5677 domain-containing protein [Ligilactobacillus cholophilus]|uniref:DUF5677 domain-containing protein n=1 Tax=Ligilactobacillus cholophilus TaxID=3050131 RepID=UPI0025B24A51|nr:DUF5677 domain-containing protein [Ligilactobacillus cholophilus]
MNNLFEQVKQLTEEISKEWNKTDSIVSKTVTQMAKLNLELTDNFLELVKNKMPIAARIIARPVYERSVFLQFILHDRREISSRALLFYHSSRLRQYLWLNYILKDPTCFKNFEMEQKWFKKQSQFLKKNKKGTLKNWVSQQIENEKQAFNRIENMVNYCEVSHFDKDERRKTWYRLDPEVFGGNLKISTLSDVSKYVLNDPQNYYYNLFYGIDSLFTHGYLISDIFPEEANEFKIALLNLCLGNLKAMCKFMDLSVNQEKQLNLLTRKVKQLHLNKQPLRLTEFEEKLDDKKLKDKFKVQIEQNFKAYQWLENKHYNYALHILLRTINEQVMSWKWMLSNNSDKRIKLFALTSQIQTISDIYRLCVPNSKEQQKLSHLRRDKKDIYDELANDLMRERTIKKDKQKRRWFVLESNAQTVHSMHQLEHVLLPEDGEFSYLYANGFLSVHVHGINLELPYSIENKTVFLLAGVTDKNACHHVTEKLWNLFKSEE